MGSPAGRGGFPAEMFRLRSSGNAGTEAGGEEYERNSEKVLKSRELYGKINIRDIF